MKLSPCHILHLPDSIPLVDDEVHIWQCSAKLASEQQTVLASLLTPEERQRAQQFVFAKDQHRFIVARGMLRQLLGIYLHHPPELINFAQHAYGKPYLANPGFSLEFNISHSHELILIAISHSCPVGIDLEFMRDNVDIEAIAQRFFAAPEWSMLSHLPEAERRTAFFQCWSKKEAIIKMLGTGLYQALTEIDVLQTTADRFVVELFPAPHYAAALCTPKPVSHIEYLAIPITAAI